VPSSIAWQVCVYGRHVFMGYLKNETETCETLSEDGWLYTGDVGKLDDDGYLYITGRLKGIYLVQHCTLLIHTMQWGTLSVDMRSEMCFFSAVWQLVTDINCYYFISLPNISQFLKSFSLPHLAEDFFLYTFNMLLHYFVEV